MRKTHLNVLEEQMGSEAADALVQTMEESSRSRAEEIVRPVVSRLERRLGEEVAMLGNQIANLRVELNGQLARLQIDVSGARADVIKWCFLFWIGQVGAIAGLLLYLK